MRVESKLKGKSFLQLSFNKNSKNNSNDKNKKDKDEEDDLEVNDTTPPPDYSAPIKPKG